MKSLVTGGAGFIGSNLVDALVARGDQVTVIDDLSTGKRGNLERAIANGATLEAVDIRYAEAVGDVVARTQPEVIFHLAAQIDVRKSVADPAADARINVEGTANMLAAAQAHGVRRFVNTSTGGAIYGDGRQIPAPEDHRARLRRPTASRVVRRAVLRDLHPPPRPLDRVAPLRQRLWPAPGPARRGRRDRDLLRQGTRRRGRRSSSATAFRRATTSTWTTWSTPTSARPTPDTTGPINIGLGQQKTVLDIVDVLKQNAPDGFEPNTPPPAPARSSTAPSTCRARAKSSAGRRR